MFTGPDIVTDGLVSLLDSRLSNSSTQLYDPISGGTMTLYNGAYIGNTAGDGIFFDGTNDYGTSDTIFRDAYNFGTGDFSIDIWVKQHVVLGSWRGILTKGSSGATGFALLKHGSSNTTLSTSLDSPDNTHFNNSDADYSSYINKWVCLSTTWDRSGSASIYFNGRFVASNDISGQSETVSSTISVTLASWQGNSWWWDGQMDCIRAYNRVLTSQEVLKNYNTQKSRFNL